MFKKIIFTMAMMSVTNAAMASGPYLGAGLGIITTTSSAYQQSVFSKTPSNFRGAPVNVFAGFGGLVYDCIYLAGELTGTIVTAEFSDNKGLKTSYSYGASILPGLMVNDRTLVFARGGVVRSRFSDANSSQTGGLVGLGVQIAATQNLDFRGEYNYTTYGTFNNKFGKINSPQSDSFNVAMVYKFE